jgi:hypothetical protein
MPRLMNRLGESGLILVAIILILALGEELRGQSAVSALRPVSLLCEYLVNPLGIDAVKPRLRWVFESKPGERGRKQTAYQILVALLEKEGIKTGIQLSEAPFRGNSSGLDAPWNYPTVLDDPEARKYVAALPYHGYDFIRLTKPPTRENGYDLQELEKLAELHKRYPDLPLWMTEVCFWTQGTPWVKPIPRDNYEDSDVWINQITSDLEAGSSGWTYWNMILDQNGGPWLISPIHHDPDDNVQQPVVIINRDIKKICYSDVYYAIAHFSKFDRPGSARIGSVGAADGIRCVAFIKPDGQCVTELVNSRELNSSVLIEWRGKTLERPLPPISITTLLWRER